MFYKPVSALQSPGGPIVIPRDATDLHYEGELVMVIGKRARNVSREEARDAIFGVTCGNDVSERNWQIGAGQGFAVVARQGLRHFRAAGAGDRRPESTTATCCSRRGSTAKWCRASTPPI